MAKTPKRKVVTQHRTAKKRPSRRESHLQRTNDRLTLELGMAKQHIEQLSNTNENLLAHNAAFRNLGFCMRGPDWPFLDFERMVKAFTNEELNVLITTIKNRTDPAIAEYAVPVSFNEPSPRPQPAQAAQ